MQVANPQNRTANSFLQSGCSSRKSASPSGLTTTVMNLIICYRELAQMVQAAIGFNKSNKECCKTWCDHEIYWTEPRKTATGSSTNSSKISILWHHFGLPKIVKQELLNIYLSIFVLQSIPPNLSCIQTVPLGRDGVISPSSLQMPAIHF